MLETITNSIDIYGKCQVLSSMTTLWMLDRLNYRIWNHIENFQEKEHYKKIDKNVVSDKDWYIDLFRRLKIAVHFYYFTTANFVY